MFQLIQVAEIAFQSNIKDWCLGGPKADGWTRTGPAIRLPSLRLKKFEKKDMLIDDVLSKNSAETKRWHVSFLLGNETNYWNEYLFRRYDIEKAEQKAANFKQLLVDVRSRGVIKPVLVADVEFLNLGFKYFRFDGCHRSCAAKVVGFTTVPALIFKVELY